MRRATLTACLIVQDEERHLPAALESLSFCDEIVVVDGGSRDRTVALARDAEANVIENPWPGFAAQRNVALHAATGDWVLEVDADERVSPDLRHHIEVLLTDASTKASVAVFPLRHRFLGAQLGPSGKYPAYRTRLWRRGAYEHDESRQVHEGVEPRERPAVLSGDLEHELADSLGEALADAWRYARLESAHIFPPGDPMAYLVGIVLRPAMKLLYRLTLDGGWRDGWRGLVKVALDASSDALVWCLVLIRRLSRESIGHGDVRAAGRPESHFGRRPAGPPKVVALAHGATATARALDWLSALAESGVDVALVCDESAVAPQDAIPGRRLRRLTPLRALRALDIEMQIRTAHAVVPFDTRSRLLAALLPGALTPSIEGIDADTRPEQAITRLRAALRWS
ncbi:MAG: glycosyltransferase family 2 protein [Solirubrobacteraceae bacterium]